MSNFLVGLMALPSLLGGLFIWHVARPQTPPADSSNRINKIRLLWFALTHEEMFVDTFPWLTKDEAANMNGEDHD